MTTVPPTAPGVLTPEAEQALTPVRDWLLADARREGDAERAAAGTDAEARLDAARSEAAQIVEAARAEGEALGAESAARELARSRREARSVVLGVQAELATMLRDRARSAVAELGAGPEGPALRAHLDTRARGMLGPSAVVGESAGGGRVAVAGSRRVDLSWQALADAALARLGAEVTRLWS
jgi:vacuolar-type H+-ATPase subunit H